MFLSFVFILPAITAGQLLSGAGIEYRTVPGYQYAGDTQVYSLEYQQDILD